MPHYFNDLTGKKFGRLTVVKLGKIDKKHDYKVYWLCQCVCGIKKMIGKYGLTSGNTVSCGCYNKEIARQVQFKYIRKHGMTGTVIHHIYKGMRQRCNNPKAKVFKNYGGRGIKCEWTSFEQFYKDMGDPPSAKHSIDRIDNNGNYCKENCRWATRKEQANNRRSSSLITFNERTQTMAQWADEKGMSPKRLWFRLQKWPVERALTEPLKSRKFSQ